MGLPIAATTALSLRETPAASSASDMAQTMIPCPSCYRFPFSQRPGAQSNVPNDAFCLSPPAPPLTPPSQTCTNQHRRSGKLAGFEFFSNVPSALGRARAPLAAHRAGKPSAAPRPEGCRRMSGSVFDPNFEFNAPKVSPRDERSQCLLAPPARQALCSCATSADTQHVLPGTRTQERPRVMVGQPLSDISTLLFVWPWVANGIESRTRQAAK
jgi:hypothetical protein